MAEWPLSWAAVDQPRAQGVLSVITDARPGLLGLSGSGSGDTDCQSRACRAGVQGGGSPETGCSVWLALVGGSCQQRVGDMVSVAACWLVGGTGQASAGSLRGGGGLGPLHSFESLSV